MTSGEWINIKGKLIHFFKTECNIGRDILDEDDSLFFSGTLDSLDIIKLVNFIETNFAITIKPLEVSLENFDTITLLCGFINERLMIETTSS